MARQSKSSKRWLDEHFSDKYVLQAKQEGYRSRAVYKLKQLDESEKLFRPGMRVVDLGAAPGGWSQYAASRVKSQGRVVASDILAMEPLESVLFIQGDFREQEVLDKILDQLQDGRSDLVMSDMAPNMSGAASVDQAKSMYLVELAADLASQILCKNGTLVMKVFQGEGFDPLCKQLKAQYKKLKVVKPTASRPRSREVYLVASGFNGIE